jgi:hypothetical protein
MDAGACGVRALLSGREIDDLRAVADRLPVSRAGQRIFADIARFLKPGSSVGSLAADVLGAFARPVRAVMFDKSASSNWAVGWHQDRTIAVRVRREVARFGPWSIKAGVHHVEPPFDILEGMITLRVHLDDCNADNAPLLIAPGSHRIGRIASADAARIAAGLGSYACKAAAGDVWAYATPILHSSCRAQRPSRRRVLQVDYAADDLPGGLEWLGLGQI